MASLTSAYLLRSASSSFISTGDCPSGAAGHLCSGAFSWASLCCLLRSKRPFLSSSLEIHCGAAVGAGRCPRSAWESYELACTAGRRSLFPALCITPSDVLLGQWLLQDVVWLARCAD